MNLNTSQCFISQPLEDFSLCKSLLRRLFRLEASTSDAVGLIKQRYYVQVCAASISRHGLRHRKLGLKMQVLSDETFRSEMQLTTAQFFFSAGDGRREYTYMCWLY